MERRKAAKDRIHQLLHILWTKAVGTAQYNKKEWLELECTLNALEARRK